MNGTGKAWIWKIEMGAPFFFSFKNYIILYIDVQKNMKKKFIINKTSIKGESKAL